MRLPERLGVLRDAAAFTANAIPSSWPRPLPPEISWSLTEANTFATSEPADTRLLLAPANYAHQGFHWARAAQTLPNVAATNMSFPKDPRTHENFSDVIVRPDVVRRSRIWAKKQDNALRGGEFTHLIMESCLPINPALYSANVEREVEAYLDSGLRVAMLAHGTDVRLPSMHAQLEPDSPYRHMPKDEVAALEAAAQARHRILDRLGLQEFVSTPDLLHYRPNATLLPIVTDTDRWLNPVRVEDGTANRITSAPKVLHIPGGAPLMKGSEHIRSAMTALDEAGIIQYAEVTDVPHESIPELIKNADIVVNQVAMGLYSLVAVEALLAGKVVVAQVWDSVRELLEKRLGEEVPVVEASPDTLYDVVRGLAEDPELRAKLAARGQQWALEAHSPDQAAQSLTPFLSNQV